MSNDLLPDFELASSEGQDIRASDYRGACNLIVILTDDPDSETCLLFLTGLAQHYDEFAQEDTEVLAIIQGSVREARQVKRKLDLPFPVLADPDARAYRATDALTSDDRPLMTVYITDQYNEVQWVYRADAGYGLPTLKEMLEHVRYLEIRCPE
jgi:peroxiredoxin